MDDQGSMDVDAQISDLTQQTGAANDTQQAAAYESRASPAAASLVWHTQPDGTVQLPEPAAGMDDADDPGEDDVDMLPVDEVELEDDVTAVGGDIMGVGPTWGTVAGDPTSNLGRLGPELLQQVGAGDDDSSSMPYTRSDEQPSLVFPSAPQPGGAAAAAGGGAAAAGGMLPSRAGFLESGGGVGPMSSSRGVGVGEPEAAVAAGDAPLGSGISGGSNGGGRVAASVLGVEGGQLSAGDADVRGIEGQVVHEDADDLPLGFSRAGVAGDAAALGADDTLADPDAGGEGGAAAAGRVGQLGDISGAASPPRVPAAAAGETSAGADFVTGGDAGGEGGDDEAADEGGVVTGVGGSAGQRDSAPVGAAGVVDVGAAGVDDGEGAGDVDVEGAYGPEEVDGLEAGAIEEGDFVPASYVRHRSQGQAGVDADPRRRPDFDPKGGLSSLLASTPEAAAAVAAIEGLPGAHGPLTVMQQPQQQPGQQEGRVDGQGFRPPPAAAAAAAAAAAVLNRPAGDTSSHPVMKDDFAMGSITINTLTDNAVLVTDYTEEPKYAAEVSQQLAGPAEKDAGRARVAHASSTTAAAPAGPQVVGGVPMGSGQPQVLAVGAAPGPAASGGGSSQQQQGGVAGADARHLGAIFAPPR